MVSDMTVSDLIWKEENLAVRLLNKSIILTSVSQMFCKL